MKDFIVLEIDEKDIEECAKVIIDANNLICEALGYPKNDDTSAAVSRLKDEHFADSRILKGVSGGEIVATFTVRTIGDEKKSYEIIMMAVRPDCPRQGFGQKMLEYAQRYVSAQGGTGLFAAFPAGNETVGLWLEKNEFFVDGFFNHPSGEICIMQKAVTPAEGCGSEGCSSCSSCG